MTKLVKEDIISSVSNKVGSHGGNEGLYTICIDTLALTLKPIEQGRVFTYSTLIMDYGHDVKNIYNIGEEYVLTNSAKNDPSYRYSFHVLWHGEKIAELHINGNRGKKEFIKLNFECHVFYQLGKGWFDHYTDIARILRLTVNNVFSIHVAYDSYGAYQPFRDKYMLSHWILGKNSEYTRYIPLTDALYSLAGTELIVGKVKTGKRVACYPKYSEIKKSGKWYISDFHKCNGLDVNAPIDRVEARMANSWLKNYKISLEELNTQKGLEMLFLTAVKDVGFKDKLTMVKNKSTDYKAKYEKVYLISPDLFDGRVMKKVEKSIKENAGKKSKHVLHSTFKSLIYAYIITGNVQDLYYLRYFMDCDFNWTVSNENNIHHGLINLHRLNKDNFRKLTLRYAADYVKEGHVLSTGIEERLQSIEKNLFDPQPAPIVVMKGSDQLKIMSVCAAIYSSYLFVPSQL